MKINSELPMCMLGENNKINGIDFILHHLLQSNEEYRKFWMNRDKSRVSILDNSGYEYYIKGETVDMSKFVEDILELKPTYYILPDYLMRKESTLSSSSFFLGFHATVDSPYGTMNRFPDSKPMGVLQGNSVEDFAECMSYYKTWNDTYIIPLEAIAIPFHNGFFKEMKVDDDIVADFLDVYDEITEDHRYAMGRIQYVRDHFEELRQFKYVHFLGSHCPLEVMYYKDFESMDTAYPVKLAVERVTLGDETHKPTTLIDDFFEDELEEGVKQMIRDNVDIFATTANVFRDKV